MYSLHISADIRLQLAINYGLPSAAALLRMVLTRLLVMIMAASGKMDELIKEYLLYRGFTATAKALETESKHAKDKCFRVCTFNESNDTNYYSCGVEMLVVNYNFERY